MTDNLFGAQTTHVLAKLTSWLAVAFFAMTLLLSIITAKTARGKTAIQESLLSAPIPQATASPSAAPAAGTDQPVPAPAAAPVASPAN